MQASLRESLEAKPEPLSVVNEEFERRAGAIAKDKEGAGEGVLSEGAFAKRDKRINPLAKIDGLVSEQNVELWNELNHRDQGRRKFEQSVASEATSSCGKASVIRAPSGRSSTRRQSV
jgi:hypothetical protein